jgi:hypothetical protein
VPEDATSCLVEILERDPEYVLDLMADFAGDPDQYVELAENEEIDFLNLTAAQLGNAIRLGIERVPPGGLPQDLNLDEVDWASVGARLDQILMTAMGGG